MEECEEFLLLLSKLLQTYLVDLHNEWMQDVISNLSMLA